MEIKKQIFDGQELAMLFKAFSKRLFVRPCKGDIQSIAGASNVLYFKLSYYDALKDDIEKAYYAGKFKKSNAEAEWVDLMKRVLTAEDSNIEESSAVEDYYELVNRFW